MKHLISLLTFFLLSLPSVAMADFEDIRDITWITCKKNTCLKVIAKRGQKSPLSAKTYFREVTLQISENSMPTKTILAERAEFCPVENAWRLFEGHSGRDSKFTYDYEFGIETFELKLVSLSSW